MTIRRSDIFADPKSGASYLYGAKLPSTDANAILSALRNMESSAYQAVARNWSAATTVTAGSAAVGAATFDESLGMWVVFWDASYTPAAKSTVGGQAYQSISLPSTPSGFKPFGAASNGAGKFVVCAEPSSGTTDTILESTDGVTWTLRSLATSNTQTADVCWDPASSLFVAVGVSGLCETSSDGITWTARTVPGALSSASFSKVASNELSGSNGLILATPGSGTAYMYSSDGVNWTEGTFPVTGLGDICTYAKGSGVWMVGDIAGPTLYTSTNGTSWTATNAPTGASEVDTIVGFGDIFVATWLDGSSNAYVSFTEDNGSTWTKCFDLNTSSLAGKLVESQRQLLLALSDGNVRLSHVY